jgi:monoterpene epsilon-lactone hydrolase
VDAHGVEAYWLNAPGTAESSKVFFYLHGGGYSRGSLDATMLASPAQCAMPEVGHRLAPEFPFPSAYEDTVAAWHWLISAAGIDPGAVIVAGDSAGGGLALGLMHCLRDAGKELPAAAVLISPYLDLTSSGISTTERAGRDPTFTPEYLRDLTAVYLNGADPRDPIASPLFASQVGLPPLLIQVGSAEILLSDSERLASAAAMGSVEVTLDVAEALPHVYHCVLDAPETIRAIEQIADFARRF